MASSGRQDQDCPKFPLRRLEQTVQKFIKILQIDLERLQKHKDNIERFQRLGEWQNLNREHINASRTVQQLKANVREIENTRSKVRDEDINAFDNRIENIRQEATLKTLEFLELYGTKEQLERAIQAQGTGVPLSVEVAGSRDLTCHSLPVQSTFDDSISEPDYHRHDSPDSVQILQHQHRQQLEAEESSESLHQNLMELSSLMVDFSQLVHDQKEKVDTIDENMTVARRDVSKGTAFLAKAAKLKAAAYPVAGALIGGVVGGPVGLVAGVKLGVAAAIGGGIIGVTSGSLFKRYQDKRTDMEMKKLNERSSSCPENLDKLS